MKKMLVNKKELNEEELRTGKVSYRRAIERLIGDIVLCNNITNVDYDIFYNIINENYYDTEEDEEEYQDEEFYQYYLCNLDEYEKDFLKETDIIISYSEVLDCDVLMVSHYGTSWDYVMTDIEWTDNPEEL